jgi:hypothetical protein
MGASETGNFANDDASDWVYELEESSGADLLKEAFATIDASSFPDAPDCCIALAAAEVVAAAHGKPSPALPKGASTWLGNQTGLAPIKALGKRAIAIVNKISAKSELRERWEESDSWHEWQQEVEGLLRRLHH